MPNGLAPLALLVVLIGMAWVIFHDATAHILLVIGRAFLFPVELLLGWASPRVVSVSNWIDQAWDNVEQVTAGALIALSAEIGRYYRWVLLLVAGGVGYIAWRNPMLHLNRRLDAEQLLKYQSSVWKPVVPVLHRDLTNDTSPEWAPSKSSATWAREHNLIHARRLNIPEAYAVLSRDLIPWGSRPLRDHEQALFAVFALRILRDKASAERLLDDLNESSRGKGVPNFSIAKKVYAQVKSRPEVKAVIAGHHYISTVLFEMLVQSRAKDGKLATANFLWLRPLDRPLWYALDRAPVDPGRTLVSSFTEGAATVSQWQAECVAKNAGLRMGLTRTIQTPDGESRKIVVRIPYLLTVLAAIVIDLDEMGLIDLPSEIRTRLREHSANERNRFRVIRDHYVFPSLDATFKRVEQEQKDAAIKRIAAKTRVTEKENQRRNVHDR